MDCRLEPAARTLVRIECLTLLGVLYAVFKIALSILFIPITILKYPLLRLTDNTRGYGWFRRLLMMPIWVVVGVWIAITDPLITAYKSILALCVVAIAEWINRWMASTPKRPNGKPLPKRSAEYEDILDAVVERSMIRDYGTYL